LKEAFSEELKESRGERRLIGALYVMRNNILYAKEPGPFPRAKKGDALGIAFAVLTWD
jgi:hypothetical protein